MLTEAQKRAQQKFRENNKQIIFTLPNDSDLLEWLRSQVSTDRELPQLIIDLLSSYQK